MIEKQIYKMDNNHHILSLHAGDTPLHINTYTSVFGSLPSSLGEIAALNKKRRQLSINQGKVELRSLTTNHRAIGRSPAETPLQVS